MGKWTQHKGKMAKFQQEAGFQQKVDQVRRDLVPLKLAELAAKFKLTNIEKKELGEKITDLNVILEALQQEIAERLEGQDITSVTIDGTMFYMKDTPYVSLDDKLKFFSWVRSSGREDLFSINHQTTKALVSELIQSGQQVPPGIKTFLKTSIEMRSKA